MLAPPRAARVGTVRSSCRTVVSGRCMNARSSAVLRERGTAQIKSPGMRRDVSWETARALDVGRALVVAEVRECPPHEKALRPTRSADP